MSMTEHDSGDNTPDSHDDLRPSECWVLVAIERREPIRPKTLRKLSRFSDSGMSTILEDLKARDLIESTEAIESGEAWGIPVDDRRATYYRTCAGVDAWTVIEES